ncbi:alpha-L-fucosidase-like isoform X2 [Actinia tenebrosa]|uniref:alpha-L-fucosidase n=1 Tax=Actinia tenebrosa TaxID=6105 RepID=A0A6P8I114_ACTTE|nr:alpha-L-fucosidase-like isoform X2 [Actinia tenebrosa]
MSLRVARYVVFTSKHHEGWTNWGSKWSWNWNSVDNGPHRDLVGEIASSLRQNTNITVGLYYSLYEWFNPLYLQDKKNGFNSTFFIKDKILPELHEIVNKYKPEYIWSDGDWEASDAYWESKAFLAWLFNESPVKDSVVVNDRWGAGCMCHHGSVFTCSDNYNPGVLVKHKWENAMSMDKMSWGYRRNATQLAEYNTIQELIGQLVTTVSCGGNLLLNVGPTADGRIIPAFQERLLQIGEWLNVNGEAIYGTKPWRAQNDTLTKHIWYTSKESVTYAIVLEWPDSEKLELGQPITTEETEITMLGYPGYFKWTTPQSGKGIIIDIPIIPFNKLPTKWAWTFKILNVF